MGSRYRFWIIIPGVFLALATAGSLNAHKTSLTTSQITVSGSQAAVRLKVSAHDMAVALGIETDLIAPVPQSAFEQRAELLGRYLKQRFSIQAQSRPCPPLPLQVDYSLLPEDLLLLSDYDCAQRISHLSITYLLFFDIDPAHRSIGRILLSGGQEQFLFDRSLTRLELTVDQPTPPSGSAHFGRILLLGLEHILRGYDHLLFLLALLVVSNNFWQMVKIATAFTAAHSITLALAWYGVIDLPSRIVESAIALSIAFVALENIIRQRFGQRWILAGVFGLVHGLGFYSALRDMGLDQSQMAVTLLAFNLGVEAGQVAVIALVYGPIIWWSRQLWYQVSARVCSILILLVASWWVIERVFIQ